MGGNSLFSGLPAPAPLPSDPVDPSLIRPEPVPPGPSILASAASAKRAAEKSGKEGAKRVRFQSNEVEASEEQVLGAISKIASHINYQTLFKGVQDKLEAFDASQQAQIEVWELWANLANEFRTDDTYVFSKAASRVRQSIDSLPEATEEDELAPEEIDTGSGDLCGPDASSNRGANSVPMKADDGRESESCEPVVESDPFGLNALLPRPSKKEERARRKRDEEAASKKAQEDAARMLREQREGLLACLKLAADHYKLPWAQTIIDILVKHAFEKLSKFTVPQRKAVEQLWGSIREQQSRRRQGKSTTGKLDVTPFERLQSQYANERISIRRAVGSSGERSAEQWLG
ncbi:hypothetical protein Mp_4g04000 [Marchantia polymorpha subsp. ruderalis]|uniref:Uncharacterized protein n=2 Tax=Marchantia polymorpha TaxID=3197 RepID=A0AAF6B641_MARPO|nr:hypothetical protein MARPO_0044s0074 [Marchantia polymorpha]BBN07468.1 hypothetical protein Mp_4g04000 [Marchantia polymorpha subsp. ruderalis]PTQ39621.1 hypothetical protein MARPO_0044s0074 [Marchantia polymorpha]PTQ39622.1 hypothetical protein MARPO_0044s0074 [Marchantia polymorpha]PTQ39623.1 hypothetical protein MARPO_0044s0074 [Marchantia polymorpha]|eukprot:PTQ39620.1 hypothetical protein MARPO_0044s0074 [Marchantia polymorpha]